MRFVMAILLGLLGVILLSVGVVHLKEEYEPPGPALMLAAGVFLIYIAFKII